MATPNATETISYSGSKVTRDVSAYTEIYFELAGAGGGAANGNGISRLEGADGGYVSGYYDVSNVSTLEVWVGQAGGDGNGDSNPGDGGWGRFDGGGGRGQNDPDAGGGGGGGSTEIVADSIFVAAADAGGGSGGETGFANGGGGARGGLGGAGNYRGLDGEGSGFGGNGGSEFDPAKNGGQEVIDDATNTTQTKGGGNSGNGEVYLEFYIAEPAQPSTSVSYVADDQLDLSITADTSGGEIDNYEVEIDRDGNGWMDPSGGPSTPSADGTYSYGPNSDTAYGRQVGIDSQFQFRVRASNSGGSSDWTTTETVYTTPVPPHNPSVSRPDANTIDIEFTQQSDIPDYWTVEFREDTGSGYGSWQALTNGSSSMFSAPSGAGLQQGNNNTGDKMVIRLVTTSESYQYGPDLSENARYQFRLTNTRRGPNQSDLDSEYAYSDYGNEGNVYFEDDFESGDLSAWDSNNLAGDTGVQSGSGDADLTIGGADTGTYYFYGEGEGSDQGTYIQKNLGDLSNESDVHVRCAFATASLDDGAEDFGISWYDGSSWQSLEHLQWEYNKQGWVEVHATVPSSALSTDNRIRVGTTTSTGMYSGDHFAVDRVVVSDILHEYTNPSAPSQASLDTSTEGQITATWNTNSPSFFNDNVRWGEDGSGNNNYGGGNGSFTATGLIDGEKYFFAPRSYKYQHRRGSNDDLWLTEAGENTAVTQLPAPTNLSVSNVTATSADLSWTNNDNNADAQRVYLKEGGEQRTGMSFDGTQDYIDCGKMGISGDFTAFARVAGGSDEVSRNIFGQWDDNSADKRSILLGLDSGVRFDTSNDGTFKSDSLRAATPSGDFTATVQHESGTNRIFTNGEQAAVGTADAPYAADTPVQIGAFSLGEDWHFDSTIYEVAVWNRALSESEISQASSGGLPTDGLIGYWPLDLNQSGTTPDLSPYNNDGTVNGPTLTGPSLTDATGNVGGGATNASLTGLENGELYEAVVHTETEHSTTRDQ